MVNIFIEKSYAKCGGVEKLFPDPFVKNQNSEYIWINSIKFIFIACQVEVYRQIMN